MALVLPIATRLRRFSQQSAQADRETERRPDKATEGACARSRPVSHHPLTRLSNALTDAHMQAQQELDQAKEVFELLNDQLVRELPVLLEQRVPYFDPSFEAMIRMQCKFAEEGYEKLSGVQR